MGIAFIVDGILEKNAIMRMCDGVPIRVTNLNGRSVDLAAIAERVYTLIKLLKDRYYPIFVIVDREGREQKSNDIEVALTRILIEKGLAPQNIVVSCPDRMIENWLIAGNLRYKESQLSCCADCSADGLNGKAELKKSLRQVNVTYGETTIGVEMCVTLDPKLGQERSPSFARFLNLVEPYCAKWRYALAGSVSV